MTDSQTGAWLVARAFPLPVDSAPRPAFEKRTEARRRAITAVSHDDSVLYAGGLESFVPNPDGHVGHAGRGVSASVRKREF